MIMTTLKQFNLLLCAFNLVVIRNPLQDITYVTIKVIAELINNISANSVALLISYAS